MTRKLVRATAEIVEISGGIRAVPDDPDDDKFIETAQVGRADLIVSGDRHLLSLGLAAGLPITTARGFLDQPGGTSG